MTDLKPEEPSAGGKDSLAAVPFPALQVRRPRERLLEAVLLVSGELGYDQVTVKHIIERAEVSRGTFYKYFADRDDCFVQAYLEASEWLFRRVIGFTKRQANWRDGLRVGLAELLDFCANQPATAKALFVEPHAAGGESLAQHDRLMERTAEVIDMARDDAGSQGSPPPSTSTFMVGAIEAMISGKLSNGEAEKAPEMLPGLLHFVVMQYFGEEAAWEDMTAAPLATWDAQRRAAYRIS
jgi:AcrR family transcriptional regulator